MVNIESKKASTTVIKARHVDFSFIRQVSSVALAKKRRKKFEQTTIMSQFNCKASCTIIVGAILMVRQTAKQKRKEKHKKCWDYRQDHGQDSEL
ncbi:CLUMA_CG016815, isoform A [Clunio marinus]|uniref:CLUMA_CG016815, isoform A n=1 Tax=Clunio marinus TaxID=568069 RepID=A0A1J1IRX9_9DIPT|nr:CLUMA_CG016815, isoform A [Clunio marinus]